MSTYVKVKDLPIALTSLLRSQLEYNSNDIAIESQNSISPCVGGGQGSKGYFATIDLTTGEAKVTWGSWGGANIFNPSNRVDLDDQAYALPSNVIAIKGQIGAIVYATLYANPITLAPLLPPSVDITPRAAQILSYYNSLTSAARKEYLERAKVTMGEIDDLVACGYLKKQGKGLGITTEGKNVASKFRV